MDLLLVAATTSEIRSTLQTLGLYTDHSVRHGAHTISVLITGVGAPLTILNLTRHLAAHKYDLVLQAGVGGSYDPHIPPGSLVRITSDLFADLGIEDHDDYLDLYQTGLADPDAAPFVAGKLPAPDTGIALIDQLTPATGLTVNTVTGSARTVALRSSRFGCAVESMEGAALHLVCLTAGQSFAQVRSISNFVTPRDRASWKMKEAIIALNQWLMAFVEEGNTQIATS
jgi:futalosine hydrolase